MVVFKRSKEIKQLLNKLGNGKIKIVTGLRQCGKTYLLNTLFFEKLKTLKRINEKTFLKIDLLKDHSRFRSESDFRYLLSQYALKNPTIIFIDEVQLAENYQNVLIEFLLNNPKIDLYVTGSNSNTLSSDILKHFKEYGDQVHITPLTYREIKRFKRSYEFSDYLKYGGIPIVVNSKNKFEQLNYVFNQVYELDILERLNKIGQKCLSKNDCSDIFSNIVSSPTHFSISAFVDKIARKTNASNDKKIEIRKAINDYLDILEQSFLVTKIKNFDFNNKVPLERIDLGYKYYCVDCGIAYLKCNVAQHKFPLSLEHAIFLHLLDKGVIPECLLFLGEKNKMDGEVDFVYENKYIQVAYTLSNYNSKREVENLKRINDDADKVILFVNNEYDGDYGDVKLIEAERFLLEK